MIDPMIFTRTGVWRAGAHGSSQVPRDWRKINTTKAQARFRPPRVAELLRKLNEVRASAVG
jgi:3'-phosphoadenosine 5'-phosphosulfate sulfotransferase